MRYILYTRPDGGLTVRRPVINTHPQRENITEAEAEQRAWDKLPPDAINPEFIEGHDIKLDRTLFRDAWEKDGNGGIRVNMPKAREIHKNALRRIRKPLLEVLDVEYQRADEDGNAVLKAQIIARKRVLRDVTDDPAIEAATTPEALKAVMPAALIDERR